jgi:hypothetical protein
MNRRNYRKLMLLPLMLLLAGCAGTTTSSATSTATSVTTSETASTATSTTSTGTSTSATSTTSGTGTITGTYSQNGSQSVTYTSTNSGAGTATKTLAGAYLITGDCTVEGGTWTSTTANQAVFLVVGSGNLTIKNATIVKDGTPSSVGDDHNFYGLNSAVVAAGSSAKITMSGCTLNVASSGSNAVFSGAGATITVSDTTIDNKGTGNSRGLHATYGGTINASGMTITTAGKSCAAVATDRGGGYVNLTGSATAMNTLTTTGQDSPCLYSTGVIKAAYVTGSASQAQAMVIEGSNVIKVENSTLSGKNRSSGAAVDWGAIMLYQSMSNDSVGGKPVVELIDTTITNLDSAAPMFYITNADATIYLSGTTFDNTAGNGEFLDTTTTRWTSTDETAEFHIKALTLGTLKVNLANSSTSVLKTTLYDSASVTWNNSGSGKVNTSTTGSSWTLPY